MLEDYGILTPDTKDCAIGPCKIAYERKRQRKRRREDELNAQEQVSSVYFDGKKTATMGMQRNETTGASIFVYSYYRMKYTCFSYLLSDHCVTIDINNVANSIRYIHSLL